MVQEQTFRLLKMLAWPVMMYGCERRTSNKEDERRFIRPLKYTDLEDCLEYLGQQ